MKIKFILPAVMCFLVLAACSQTKHYKPVAAAKPTIRMTLVAQEPLKAGKSVTVLAKLNNIQERTVVTEDQLQVMHTQKFHLLLVDSTLSDYQHVHPQPTATPGVYSFTFTPKLPGGYRAWADITPAGGKQQYVMSEDLGAYKAGAVNKTPSSEATVGNYHFTLAFDKPLVEGDDATGTITVTGRKGNPIASLEPVMGTYVHIVGFYDDFRTVVHTHPMGKEPAGASDRAGPALSFMLTPVKAGFIKLFAQVKIGGEEMMVPFGVVVAKAP